MVNSLFPEPSSSFTIRHRVRSFTIFPGPRTTLSGIITHRCSFLLAFYHNADSVVFSFFRNACVLECRLCIVVKGFRQSTDATKR